MRLPRSARLLRPADFAALRAGAQRLSSRWFRIEYRPTTEPEARLGMAVSRRVSKKAVVRNRIRRTVRESFRLNRAGLPSLDMLLIARSAAADCSNADLRTDLANTWRRLSALKEEHAPGTMRADS